MELLVVIAVAMMLTGLLMPAMKHVHENANRIICLSHLQQLGQGFMMYALQSGDKLPYSEVLHTDDYPPNLMAAWRGGPNASWDGMGLLFIYNFCPAAECFYCPSHHGNHPFERYADRWVMPIGSEPIFTNYHYAGDVEWSDRSIRRTLDDGPGLALASDGLRTVTDFNHFNGMNILRADGSVRWRDDTQNILATLPVSDAQPPDIGYTSLWEMLVEH